MAAQKIRATTQKFTEIDQILDNVIMLHGGNASLVIEVTATNFTLQSKEEQQTKIRSYASFLNSLSFPIQIVILSKRLDIGSYLKLLDSQSKTTQNPLLSHHIARYKEFVEKLVRANAILDKKFYIVIPFTFLEKGAAGAKSIASNKGTFADQAKSTLLSKAESVLSQLMRMNLKAKILEKNELVSVFHEIYNGDSQAIDIDGTLSPIVKGEA